MIRTAVLYRDSLCSARRPTVQVFAQSDRGAQSDAPYRTLHGDGPMDFMRKSAGLSDRVIKPPQHPTAIRWLDFAKSNNRWPARRPKPGRTKGKT